MCRAPLSTALQLSAIKFYLSLSFPSLFSVASRSTLDSLDSVNSFIPRDRKQRERERGLRDLCMAQRSLIITCNLAGERG